MGAERDADKGGDGAPAPSKARASFWDEGAKILTFAMALVTAFSIRDAVVDTFSNTPGLNNLTGIGWALLFAVCMHICASACSAVVLGSTQVRHTARPGMARVSARWALAACWLQHPLLR